jgi:predicted porin
MNSKLQLKLSALAWVLFFGSSAYAQSSVTLYGVIDAGFLYTNKTLDATTGQNSGHQLAAVDGSLSASRVGLTGSEALGDGWRVLFDLESGVDSLTGGTNNSNGGFFGREANVSLTGPYGTTTLGLQYSPFYIAIYETDSRDHASIGSGLTGYVDNVLITGLFNSNAVTYTSPKIYGVQGSVMLALGGEAGSFQAGRQYSASLAYQSGGLLVNAAIYSGNAGDSVQVPSASAVAFWGRTIGASYKFGAVTAKVQFVNYNVAQAFNSYIYGGGIDWLLSPAFDVSGALWYTSNRNHADDYSWMGGIGATYNLSKRTTLYVQAGAADNHGAMNTGVSVADALYGVHGTTIGLIAGMRHTF